MKSFHFRVTSTYTTPTLGVPNVVTASTYPQMLGLSEQVQALMPSPTSVSTLLHPQRHTASIHNTSHAKYPPPLIPVNGSNNSTRYEITHFFSFSLIYVNRDLVNLEKINNILFLH